MDLDRDTCLRALASHDPRFDGRFYTAVRTTGIYCRPVCPARRPRPDNVEFHPTAAACEEAGFRPCRRCRPERAPDAPAFGRTPAVARALRHIAAGALDTGTVTDLAARVGVGERQLARRFRAELGASPKAVARTKRAHLARRLLDETDLAMTELAYAAGYGSVRRFNDEVRAVFGRAPRELRRAGTAPGPGLRLRLPYRAPLDLSRLLAFLGCRAIPGVEEVRDGAWRRAVHHAGARGTIEVRAGTGDALELTLDAGLGRGLTGLVDRVRRLFDLAADPASVAADLARDPELAPRLARAPGLRVPGTWDGFELGVRAILGQQVTVRGARTLLGRLVVLASPDGLFPTPEEVLAADLASLGVPAARARAVTAFADAVAAGTLDLEPGADPDATRAALLALPGVGPWTAEYVALRALGDPDAFPAGDLALRKALAGPTLSASALERRAESWRPWRAYAAQLLWSVTTETEACA